MLLGAGRTDGAALPETGREREISACINCVD